MGGLAVLFTTLGSISLVAAVGVFIYFCYDRRSTEAIAATIVAGVVVTLLLAYGAYFFAEKYYENTFYVNESEWATARSAVGILEGRGGDIKPELVELIDQLVGLDEKLTQAVETRPDQLKTLIERYPELRANEKVRDLIAKYIDIVDDIVYQKRIADEVANAYNKNQGTWPAREFAPDGLPTKLPLYNPYSPPESEK